MAFNVAAFKAAGLPTGGYRPTLFEVRITGHGLGQPLSFMCQAAQVPAMTMGVIEVPYFGRKIKIAGDRTFSEWTTTVMTEESFITRNALEEWSNALNDGPTNIRTEFNEMYKEEAQVYLYSKAGVPIRVYTLTGIWPSDVGAIELDWGTNDTVATYSVTWSFDYMVPGRLG